MLLCFFLFDFKSITSFRLVFFSIRTTEPTTSIVNSNRKPASIVVVCGLAFVCMRVLQIRQNKQIVRGIEVIAGLNRIKFPFQRSGNQQSLAMEWPGSINYNSDWK